MRPSARMLSSKCLRLVAAILVCYACFNFETEAAYLPRSNASTEVQVHGHKSSDAPKKGDMVLKALENLARTMDRIPWIGPILYKFLDFILIFVGSFETLSNGALDTIIGGSLPCTLSLEYGVVCSGLYKNGGFLKLFMRALDNVPPMVVPNIAKSIIGLLIEIMTDPSSGGFFGGMPIINELV